VSVLTTNWSDCGVPALSKNRAAMEFPARATHDEVARLVRRDVRVVEDARFS
jgi:hypothetical protein